ncbi:MAG: hypothetical protein LWX83_17970 [Anaerolineae bacterium]|nr:hypothetical protein [Anaerolineae bacterium]
MENKRDQIQNQHEKQVLLQIWLPLIVGALLVLLLCTLAVLSTSNNVLDGEKFASISLILLFIPAFLAAFLFLALLLALIFGLYKLTLVTPRYSLKVQLFFEMISNYTLVWANKITQPMVNINSRLNGIKQVFTHFSKTTK